MIIESPAFNFGSEIPKKYSCEGADVSPELRFSEVPAGAKSLALICDDPDAPMGTWVHWVLFNLPPETKSLSEGLPKTQYVLKTAVQGINDFGKVGYGGPCPPPGKPHRYYFALYALKAPLDLKPGATKAQLLEAMKGQISAEAKLMGTYKR